MLKDLYARSAALERIKAELERIIRDAFFNAVPELCCEYARIIQGLAEHLEGVEPDVIEFRLPSVPPPALTADGHTYKRTCYRLVSGIDSSLGYFAELMASFERSAPPRNDTEIQGRTLRWLYDHAGAYGLFDIGREIGVPECELDRMDAVSFQLSGKGFLHQLGSAESQESGRIVEISAAGREAVEQSESIGDPIVPVVNIGQVLGGFQFANAPGAVQVNSTTVHQIFMELERRIKASNDIPAEKKQSLITKLRDLATDQTLRDLISMGLGTLIGSV